MCDVITCAAPNLSNIKDKKILSTINNVLLNRCRLILDIAYNNKVDCLILGAWGCGVFKNDPMMIASTFKMLLDTEFNGVFKKV